MDKDRMRVVIRDGLRQLNEALSDFEHTTHGVMSDGSIGSVGRYLAACYDAPSAFSVSSLSQVIDQFLDRSGAAEEQ